MAYVSGTNLEAALTRSLQPPGLTEDTEKKQGSLRNPCVLE